MCIIPAHMVNCCAHSLCVILWDFYLRSWCHSPCYCTHSLWVLRLLQKGRELQHSELGASNTSTLPRGGTGRHGQPRCALIACRWAGQWVWHVWFGRDKEQLKSTAILQLFPGALCELPVTSRLSHHFAGMTAVCQHSWGGGAPTCYGGWAGHLHGISLLGEGLNAGEMRHRWEGEKHVMHHVNLMTLSPTLIGPADPIGAGGRAVCWVADSWRPLFIITPICLDIHYLTEGWGRLRWSRGPYW